MKKIVIIVLAVFASSCGVNIDDLKLKNEAALSAIDAGLHQCEVESIYKIIEDEESGILQGISGKRYTNQGRLVKTSVDITGDLNGRTMAFYYIEDFIVLIDKHWGGGERDNVYLEGTFYFSRDMKKNYNDEAVDSDILQNMRFWEAELRESN